MDVKQWFKVKEEIVRVFFKRIQLEWCEIFKDFDVCVIFVFMVDEVFCYFYNDERKIFILSDGIYELFLVLKLFRILGYCKFMIQFEVGEYFMEVLKEVGYI